MGPGSSGRPPVSANRRRSTRGTRYVAACRGRERESPRPHQTPATLTLGCLETRGPEHQLQDAALQAGQKLRVLNLCQRKRLPSLLGRSRAARPSDRGGSCWCASACVLQRRSPSACCGSSRQARLLGRLWLALIAGPLASCPRRGRLHRCKRPDATVAAGPSDSRACAAIFTMVLVWRCRARSRGGQFRAHSRPRSESAATPRATCNMAHTHIASRLFHDVVGMFTPVLTSSRFVDEGVLTPEEFVAAGDALIRVSPLWQW